MSPSTDLSFSVFPTRGRLILLDSRASEVDLLRTSFGWLEIELLSSSSSLEAGFDNVYVVKDVIKDYFRVS